MKNNFSKILLSIGALSMAAVSANAQTVPIFEVEPQFISSDAAENPGQWHTDLFRGNAMWADINNDGWMDLFLVGNSTAAGWHSHVYVWTNNAGTFTQLASHPFVDRSDGPGCTTSDQRGTNNTVFAWIDYNNDGNIDVIQRGIKEGASAENSTTSADLFLNLYKGNGDGTFTLVENTGLEVIGLEQECMYTGVTQAVDFNCDGYQDLALSGITDGVRALVLYKNNGGDGTFTRIDPTVAFVDWQGAPFDLAISSGTVAWGDYNNDGYPDFAVNGWSDSANGMKIFVGCNKGDGTFECLDLSYSDPTAELPEQPGTQKGHLVWCDLNNDGWLDLLVSGETLIDGNWGRTCDILLNRTNANVDEFYPESQFKRITASESGIQLGASKGNAVDLVDLDNNGYMDIVIMGEGAGAQTDFIMNNGDLTFSEDNSTNKADFRSGASMEFWDYDGDGYLDFFGMGYRDNGAKFTMFHNTGYYEDMNFEQHDLPLNTKPQGPSSVGFDAEGNGVKVTWSNGSDNESSAVALRYNVAIEKTNGEIVTLVPADLTTGDLRVANLANLVYGNEKYFNIPMSEVKAVYVQTVDGGKMASAFVAGEQGASVESVDANDGISVWVSGDALHVTAQGEAVVTVYSLAGNLVDEANIDGAATLDCADYAGMYLVKVETAAACKTTKVVF